MEKRKPKFLQRLIAFWLTVIMVFAISTGDFKALAYDYEPPIALADLADDSQWIDYFEYTIKKEPAGETPGEILINYFREDGTNSDGKVDGNGTPIDDTSGPNGKITVYPTITTTDSKTYHISMQEATASTSVFSMAPGGLKEVEIKPGVGLPNSLHAFFQRCDYIEKFTMDGFTEDNAKNVEQIDYMFYLCRSVKEIHITNCDLSSAKSMDYMFSQCKNLEWIDFEGSDISGIQRVDLIFRDCNNLMRLTTPANIFKVSNFATNANTTSRPASCSVAESAASGNVVLESPMSGSDGFYVTFYEEREKDSDTKDPGTAKGDLLYGYPFHHFNAYMTPNANYYKGHMVVLHTLHREVSQSGYYDNHINYAETPMIYKAYAIKHGRTFEEEYIKEPAYMYPWGIEDEIRNNYPLYSNYDLNWESKNPEYNNLALYDKAGGKYKLFANQDSNVPFVMDESGIPQDDKFTFVSWSSGSYNCSSPGGTKTYLSSVVNGDLNVGSIWSKKSYSINYHYGFDVNAKDDNGKSLETDTVEYSANHLLRRDHNYTHYVGEASSFVRAGYHIDAWTNYDKSKTYKYFYNSNNFDSYYYSYQRYYQDIDDNTGNTKTNNCAKQQQDLNCYDGTLDYKVDLYADWKPTAYKIVYYNTDKSSNYTYNDGGTYYINGVEGIANPTTSISLKTLDAINYGYSSTSTHYFKKGAFELKGWKIAGDDTVYAPGANVSISKAIANAAERNNIYTGSSSSYQNVIYIQAVWDNKYTVRFNGRKAGETYNFNGSMDNQSVECGVDAALPENQFTRTGYHFVKWERNVNNNSLYYTDTINIPESEINAVSTNYVDLFARFEVNKFPVKFYNNFYSGDPTTYSTATVTYGISQKTPTPTMSGFNFICWSTTPDNANGSTTYSANAELGTISDRNGDEDVLKLYAIWSPVTYTVHLNTVASGTIKGSTTSVTFTYNKDVTLPKVSDIVKNSSGNKVAGTTDGNYTFLCWSNRNTQPSFENGQQVSGQVGDIIIKEDGATLDPVAQPAYNLSTKQGDIIEWYGYWAPRYTISYDLQGGSWNETETDGTSHPKDFFCGDKDIEISKPYKTGWSFEGWKITSGDAKNAVNSIKKDYTLPTKTQKNITLVATWKVVPYTITYNYNGGTLTDLPAGVTSNPVGYGTDETKKIYSPSKVGYDFTKWTVKVDDVSSTDIPAPTATNYFTLPTGSTGDRVYTAVYTPHKYTINYVPNYNKDGKGTPSTHGSNINYDSNATLKTVANCNFSKTGYTFIGWSTDYKATTATYTDGQTIKNLISENNATVTLYAVWQANPDTPYQVQYIFRDANGRFPGDSGYDTSYTKTINKTGTSDANVTLSGSSAEAKEQINNMAGIATYVYTGDEFKIGTNAVNILSGTIKPDGKSVFKLYFTQQFTVTYNKGAHGTGENVTEKVYYGDKPTLTPQFTPDTGYTMNTWTHTGTAITANTTYTATYTPINYDISYDLGTNASLPDGKTNPAEYNVETATFTLFNPIRTGYTFAGWTGSNGTTKQTEVVITKGTKTGKLSYEANWTPITYTISYDLGGGTVGSDNPASYTIVSDTFTLNNPTKTGYTFTGWTGSNGETPQKAVTISVGTIENKSYTANYKVNEHSITYNLNGGDLSNPVNTFTYETDTFNLPTPTKLGYTFGGWYEKSDFSGSEIKQIAKHTDNNIELHAKWNPSANHYKVYYYFKDKGAYPATPNYIRDSIDGVKTDETVTASDADKNINAGVNGFDYVSEMNEQNNCTYTFDADNKNNVLSAKVLPADNTTVLKVYFVQKFAITFRSEKDGDDPNKIVMPNTPAPDYVKDNGNDTYSYVHTDYVEYNANIESVADTNVRMINSYSSDTTSAQYWYDANGSYTDPQNPTQFDFSTLKVTQNMTFIAKWGDKIYYIAYAGIDDIDNAAKLAYSEEDGKIKGNRTKYTYYDANFTLINPEREGYDFLGWQMIKNGENVGEPSKTVRIEALDDYSKGDRTYEAKWAAKDDVKYTIEFYFMNEEGKYAAKDAAASDGFKYVRDKDFDDNNLCGLAGDECSISEAVIKDNSLLTEQNTAAGDDFTYVYDEGYKENLIKYNIGRHGDTILRVYYKRQFVITYDKGDHSFEGTENKVVDKIDYGTKAASLKPSFPPDTGYEFDKWSPEIDDTTEITEKTTYTAKWKTIIYDIEYELDKGTLAQGITNPATYDIETATFTLNNPTRVGYTFIGWVTADDEQADPEMEMKVQEGSHGAIKFIAKYTPNEDTKYVVKHYKQQLDGTYLESEDPDKDKPDDVDNLEGTSDSKVEPDVKTYVGFTSPDKVEISIAPDGSTVLTYKYTRNKYKLTWNYVEYGHCEDDVIEGDVYYDQPIDKIPVHVLRDGYSFKGTWDAEVPEKMPANPLTFTAQYDIITYNITYNLCDDDDFVKAKLADDTEMTFTFVDSFDLKQPSRAGYDFVGWYNNKAYENDAIEHFNKEQYGNKEFFAKWAPSKNTVYHVEHYQQGFDGKYPDTPFETDELTGETNTMVTPDRKQYNGFTSPKGQEVKILPDGSLVVRYEYTRNSYDVEWDMGPGEANNDYTQGSVLFDTPIVKPIGEYRGYEHTGFEPAVPATVTNENSKYTATYEIIHYTISYELNDGKVAEGTTPVTSYTVHDTITNAQLQIPTREYSTFLGWYYDAEFTKPVAANFDILNNVKEPDVVAIEENSIGDITFYAKWQPEKIQFYVQHYKQNIDGTYPDNIEIGDYDPTDTSIVQEELIDDVFLTVSPETKDFDGFTAPSKDFVKITPDGKALLRYYYERNTYKVVWNFGDTFSTKKLKFEDNVTPPDDIKRIGYNFIKWDNEPVEKMPNKDISYTAIYDPIEYNINYEPNGGILAKDTIKTYNIEQVVELKKPTRSGYSFVAWYDNKDLTGKAYKELPKGNTEDKTFYAKWIEDKNLGQVKDVTNISANTLAARFNDPDLVEKLGLSEDEDKAIKDGTDVKVELKSRNVSGTLSADDKKVIDSVKGSFKSGTSVDLSITKTIDGQKPVTVDKLDKPITFTIKIPDKYVRKDKSNTRTYKIVQVVDGMAKVITGTYNPKKKTYTFETDKLGLTTLIYSDDDDNGGSGSTGGKVTPAKANEIAINAGLKVNQTKKQINIKWGKVSNADGYDIYATYCGSKWPKTPIKTVKKSTTLNAKIKKLNGKALVLNKNYKIRVEAYKMVNGKKQVLCKTINAHIVGMKNTKYTNAKDIKLSKTKYTIAKGKSVTIKAKTILVDKNKKQLSDAHAKEFRYATSNSKVATVSKKGVVKAVGKGTCDVYVYSRNGYAKKVNITVK